MIAVSRLKGKGLYVNSDHIEFVESTPDTVITLSNGAKLVVEESPEVIIEKIVAFRSRIQAQRPLPEQSGDEG